MTKYEVVEDSLGFTCIKRTDADGREWFIPEDQANSDYQRYLRHLAGEDENGTLS